MGEDHGASEGGEGVGVHGLVVEPGYEA
jgi:hypothetical protein